MPVWEWLVDSAGVLLFLVLLYGLCSGGPPPMDLPPRGTFEFSVRVRSARAGRGWILGVGRYTGDALEWFRIFSLAPRPRFTYSSLRAGVRRPREPSGVEAYSLYSGHIVVTCRTPSGLLEVAMSPDALTGFLAWLEAAPPGRRLSR